MIRIGILGCGRIGQVHALGIKQIPSATLVAVADVNESAAAACADRFGVDARDASDILEGNDIDAVVIATPSSTHFDLVHAAVVARKAIFCEKPIDLSSERVRACMDAVENVGVPFMTAFNQRFDPHFGELARRVHEGAGECSIVTETHGGLRDRHVPHSARRGVRAAPFRRPRSRASVRQPLSTAFV